MRVIPYRLRRILAAVLGVLFLGGVVVAHPDSWSSNPDSNNAETSTDTETNGTASGASQSDDITLATSVLERLEIKGRAPKTGYTRDQFYAGWPNIEGCSLRQRIIRREVGETAVLASDNCTVVAGEYDEPYTGEHRTFQQKSDFSKGVQIDHVVALSDAWQKGAQNLDADTRYQIATDPLNLLAVDSSANQGKSDGDAATWLPKNKAFRCQYVARQTAVKYKYHLWVTQAEHDAIAKILEACPSEPAPGVEL